MNRPSWFLDVAAAATLLMGAAGVAAADAPSNRADPCVLVVANDVQSAFGTPTAAPKSSDDGLFRHCQYVSPDGRYYAYIDTIDREKTEFERALALSPRGKIPVSTVGAPAYIDKASGTLSVWKKGIVVNILLGDHSGNMSEERKTSLEEKIALSALSRL
jgi:hypothetical protein